MEKPAVWAEADVASLSDGPAASRAAYEDALLQAERLYSAPHRVQEDLTPKLRNGTARRYERSEQDLARLRMLSLRKRTEIFAGEPDELA